MEGADTSRKRKADAALDSIARPRLTFGQTITLKITHEHDGTRDFIVHGDMILQRSNRLEVSINAKTSAVEGYLNWVYLDRPYSTGDEIKKMADHVANWTMFRWNYTSGAKEKEQDTVYRTLGLFDLWYVGHLLEDKNFCNLVMDAICQQDLSDHLIPVLTKWVWKCRCAEGCWDGRGGEHFFVGPFHWLLDRLAVPGHSVTLLPILRNEKMTEFAIVLLAHIDAARQDLLGLERPLGTVVARDYHVM